MLYHSMYCYILDKGKGDWIESNDLFPHDIALLIDTDTKSIYLHFGTKSTPEERRFGKELASGLLKKYETYSFEILDDVIPLKIQAEIDLLLGDNIDATRLKEPRTWSLWIFIGLSCGAIILHLIGLMDLF